MGRGLSDLQRFILVEAGRRDRLYYTDVLHHFFGFPPRPGERLRYHKPGAATKGCPREFLPSTWEDGGTLTSPGSQPFDPEEIGRGRYHAAQVSVSRACLRLGRRGLVTSLVGRVSHWGGVELTDRGRELSVALAAQLPHKQPIARAAPASMPARPRKGRGKGATPRRPG
jgi:hypothetical protein